MILGLAYYPDPFLRAPTEETKPSEDLRALVADLRDTMYSLNALGIAAPQVGRTEKIFILDGRLQTSLGDPPPLVFINPEIVRVEDSVSMAEGCLSFPTVFLEIRRPRFVQVRAMDLNGNPFEIEASGLLARAIQHEYDHLCGKLMIDHVSRALKESAHRRVKRWREQQGKGRGF